MNEPNEDMVLDLCRRARAEGTGALVVQLYRLTKAGLPPNLLKQANDAIYFAETGAEREAGSNEIAFAESKAHSSTS